MVTHCSRMYEPHNDLVLFQIPRQGSARAVGCCFAHPVSIQISSGPAIPYRSHLAGHKHHLQQQADLALRLCTAWSQMITSTVSCVQLCDCYLTIAEYTQVRSVHCKHSHASVTSAGSTHRYVSRWQRQQFRNRQMLRITFVPLPRFCRNAWTMRRGPMALMSKCIFRPSASRSPNLS